MLIEKYPAIKKAAVIVARDNGFNRLEPESQSVERVDAVLQKHAEFVLIQINAELQGLNEDQLHTFCCGEESDAEALPVSRGAHDLFDEIFEAL